MFKIAITLLLSLQWLLAGLPHTLCACGCSWLLPDQTRECDAEHSLVAASTACPHCRADRERGSHSPAEPVIPKHCDCDASEAFVAVTGDSAISAAANSAWRHSFSNKVIGHAGLPIVDRESISGTGAFDLRRTMLPVRALPILLGHLLL